MRYQVQRPGGRGFFEIVGTSFIGKPKDGSVLFITRKMRKLAENLRGHENCLVFAEEGMEIPEEIQERNRFLFSGDAQAAYTAFILERQREAETAGAGRKYTLTPEGYYLGENVTLGPGARIEPGCLIDHDVVIGKDARIGFGSRISHARIGDGFRCGDHAVIGTDAYYPVELDGRALQMPSFGLTLIGDQVDLGCHTLVERGVMGDTVLADRIMIDAHTCVGHEDDIGPHVHIACGVKLGGIVTIGEASYLGMNAVVKQRLRIGANAMVGMGAVVISNVPDGGKVFGNPARKMIL